MSEIINNLDAEGCWRIVMRLLTELDTVGLKISDNRAREVAVFGSVLRGELGADSDIDFLVEFEAGYKLRDHIRLTQGLQDLLGRRVEVVDRGSLREELRATILAEAQSL